MGRGEDLLPSAALHHVDELSSRTLTLLLFAVLEKQQQIYPLPQNLGQA